MVRYTDDDILINGITVIHHANERVLGPVNRWIPPTHGHEMVIFRSTSSIGLAGRCIVFVRDDFAIWLVRGKVRLEANLPVAYITREKSEVQPAVACTFHIRPHLPRPIFVVSNGKPPFVPV